MTPVTMRAAVIKGPGVSHVVTVPVPVPDSGQVRVKLEGCGVCSSNLPPWEGKPWFTYPMDPGALGHEGWGLVDAIGSNVTGLSIGDRVAMLSGHAYAEYDLTSANAVTKLPQALSLNPFPGEPLGCACNILQRSRIMPGDTVAIIGIGFLGSLLCRLVSNAGAHVIAIGRRSYALETATLYGAEVQILMDDHWRIIEQVKKLTDGAMCDVVIEAVGKQWPLDLATELTKAMGRLVIAGYHQDGPRQVNMQTWNWRGLDVINAHEREESVYIRGMNYAAGLVASGSLDIQPLLTHCFALEELDAALNITRDRPDGFMKALVLMQKP